MPLDENFPTFHFNPRPREPATTITHTVSGSPQQPVYQLNRPATEPNTFAMSLVDASFPSIMYASAQTALELTPQSASPPQTEPKVLLPAEFAVQLFNPDSAVMMELKHSALRGNFWEFTMPKHSFHPPSNSRIDANYPPPESERLTFRWRKEGGTLTRKQLKCSLVSPGNLPGARRNAGAAEPDVTLAMYSGVGEKSGRGELTMYESNFGRVDIEDWKGFELVLILGARIINDIYFCPTSATFNTAGNVTVGVGRARQGSTGSLLASASFPAQSQPTQPNGGTFAQRYQQKQADNAPVQADGQAHQAPIPVDDQAHKAPIPVQKPTKEEIRRKKEEEKKIAAEQEQIRKMLAEEEAREKRRRQATVDAETERLRQLYFGAQHQPPTPTRVTPPRPQPSIPTRVSSPRPHPSPIPLRPTPRPHPSRPYIVPQVVPAQRPSHNRMPSFQSSPPRPIVQPQRPPVVGSSNGGWFGGGGHLVPDSGKRLDAKGSRRKSFLGLFGGGKSSDGKPGKLRKKPSSAL